MFESHLDTRVLKNGPSGRLFDNLGLLLALFQLQQGADIVNHPWREFKSFAYLRTPATTAAVTNQERSWYQQAT